MNSSIVPTKAAEIVSPTVVDGIEFYVSKDGSKCGVSQIGLARLCGIPEASLRRHLDQFTNSLGSGARHLEAPKLLKDLEGKEFYLAISSNRQAKVVSADVAARIIQYYAFESRNKSEVAQFSLGKFAVMGIDTWIKQVTQFVESSNTDALLLSMSQTLNVLAADMAGMKAQLLKTEGYRAARVEFPGLELWMDSIHVADYERLALPGSSEEPLFTLNEWAEKAQNGLVLSKSNKHSLANMVSATYKAMSLKMPPKVVRQNAKGYDLPPVQAYPERHFTLLNMIFSKMVAQ